MSRIATSKLSQVIVVIALAALLLAGQFIADRQALAVARDSAALGRAGFAYLTGVRTFIAAVLWNRLDPIFHDYYEGLTLAEQTQMLPTIQAVIALDPQFIDAYYVAAWMLAQRGDVETGLDIARQGVENNPRSGILRMNYAQLLYLFKRDTPAAIEQIDAAVTDAEWREPAEQRDAYAVFRAIYRSAGMTEREAFMLEEMLRLDEIIGAALPEGAHDHDGDGVPDH